MAVEPKQIIMDVLAQPDVNPKTVWWLKNKDDPRIVECMREARRKYYYKNQEKEKQRGREYYYKKKALLEAQAIKED